MLFYLHFVLKGGTAMVLWKLKNCPRCGGDVFIDRDLDTWYAQCLQCSHRHEMDSPDEMISPDELEKQPVATGAEIFKE